MVVHQAIKKLFIGGIPPQATYAEFNDYFSQFGELEDVLLSLKQDGSGANNGFGFVTYVKAEDANKVLMHPKDHTIRAKWVSSSDRR